MVTKETPRENEITYSLATARVWTYRLLESLKQNNGQKEAETLVTTKSDELSRFWVEKLEELDQGLKKTGKPSLGDLMKTSEKSRLEGSNGEQVSLDCILGHKIDTIFLGITPRGCETKHIKVTFERPKGSFGFWIPQIINVASYNVDQRLIEEEIEINFDHQDNLIYQISIEKRPRVSRASIEGTFTVTETIKRPKLHHTESYH